MAHLRCSWVQNIHWSPHKCKQRLLKPFTLRITGSVRAQASDACVSVEHTASWYVLSINARDNRWSVHMLDSEPNVVCAMAMR